MGRAEPSVDDFYFRLVVASIYVKDVDSLRLIGPNIATVDVTSARVSPRPLDRRRYDSVWGKLREWVVEASFFTTGWSKVSASRLSSFGPVSGVRDNMSFVSLIFSLSLSLVHSVCIDHMTFAHYLMATPAKTTSPLSIVIWQGVRQGVFLFARSSIVLSSPLQMCSTTWLSMKPFRLVSFLICPCISDTRHSQ